MNARFTWFGHSAVALTTPGDKIVLFDPWLGNPTSPRAAADLARCDLMLVSHGHFDHIGSAPRQVREADALIQSVRARRDGFASERPSNAQPRPIKPAAR